MKLAESALLTEVREKLASEGWPENAILGEPPVSVRGKLYHPDFLLVYNLYPLAVVEVKEKWFRNQMLEQVSSYATSFDLPFGIGVSGEKVVLFERLINEAREHEKIPSPQTLWGNLGREWVETDPRLFPAYESHDYPTPFHIAQAVAKVLDEIMSGENYVSVVLATGSGKTYAIFQMLWKLLKSDYAERILYVTNRRELLENAKHTFSPLADVIYEFISRAKPKIGSRLHLGLTQHIKQIQELLAVGADYDFVVFDNILDPGVISTASSTFPDAKLINVLGTALSPYISEGMPRQPVFTFGIRDALTEAKPVVPEGYESVRLSDIATLHAGTYLRTKDAQKSASSRVFLLEPRSISPDGNIDFNNVLQIEATSPELLTNEGELNDDYIARPHDILIAPYPQSGGRIKVTQVPSKVPGVLICRNPLYRIRVDAAKIDPADVFDFLKSDLGQRTLLGLVSGSIIARINFSTLSSLPIFIPKRDKAHSAEARPQELSGIATVVRALEEKIIPRLKELQQQNISVPTDPELIPEDLGLDLLAEHLKGLAGDLVRPPLPERVMNEYPTPIAMAYRRFNDALFNIFERVLRLIDVYESSCFFVYHVILADVVHNLSQLGYFIEDKNVRQAHKSFSMAWKLDFISQVVGMAKERLERGEAQRPELFIPELLDSSFVERAKELKDFRNLVSHTATATESQQRNFLNIYQPKVKVMLNELEFLRSYYLVRIPRLYVSQQSLFRHLEVYKGVLPNLKEEKLSSDLTELSWITSADHQHLLLLNRDDEVLDLHPMYQLLATDETRHETHLCFLKQQKSSKLYGESIQGSFELELQGGDRFSALTAKILSSPFHKG
jgi:hypothetical protein